MSASIRSEAAGKKQETKKRRYRRPLILRVLSSIGTVLMTTFLSFFLLFAVTGTICAIAATMYITNYMENTTPISIQDLEISGATNIFETKKDGELELVYHVQSEQKRIPVTLDQVPQHLSAKSRSLLEEVARLEGENTTPKLMALSELRNNQ